MLVFIYTYFSAAAGNFEQKLAYSYQNLLQLRTFKALSIDIVSITLDGFLAG